MTTGALPAQGYALKRGNGASPEVFTKLAEVMDLPGTNRTRTSIEANSLDTEWDESIGGIKKGGEITFNAIFRPDDTNGQAQLEDDFDTGDMINWKIEATDSPPTVWAFAGRVDALNGPQGTTDGKLSWQVTIKISGAVTPS